jgi:hypothetical protein
VPGSVSKMIFFAVLDAGMAKAIMKIAARKIF